MKKISLALLIIFLFSGTPVLAATKITSSVKKVVSTKKTTAKVVPVKKGWTPVAPEGFTPINWAKAPGIASFFQAPDEGGSIDYLTRIYLPQNQIGFVVSTSTPIDLTPSKSDLPVVSSDIEDFHNFSFKRMGAEKAKAVTPGVKFLWDAPFFNMKSGYSDLSMALRYSVATSTLINRGSRSVPDMQLPRRMLIVNNQTGTAMIKDFDSAAFVDSKNGDQAIEGFSPDVAKSDSASGAAARLFMGVSNDGKELMVYCSQLASVEEASDVLIAAGATIDHQLEADGGGSAACGYNLPGQFFVEPKRSLPVMMGAETIIARGTIISKGTNVRSGPATKNPIVIKLDKGTAVRAYEEKSGWYRIGEGQWILKSLMK